MGPASSRRVVGWLALALVVSLACSAGTVRAQAKKSDSAVKINASASRPDADGKQTVTITLDIEKPWHLYANPVGNDDLANAQTVVSLAARNRVEVVKIDYPKGEIVVDTTAGNYRVYEGKITIKAQVKRTGGDTSPLEVSVKLQACDKNKCLLPATVKTNVP